MKVYWDSSALVEAVLLDEVRTRLQNEESCTRLHSLAEVFSTLTGGRLGFRVDACGAAELVAQLARETTVVRLDTAVVLDALRRARSLGVRGGRVHDFLHATAALHAHCTRLRTLNTRDFRDLCGDIRILPP